MKRKLLSILALLCLTASGAWAQSEELLTTITFPNLGDVDYPVNGRATLTAHGNVSGGTADANPERFARLNSSEYVIGFLTVTPAEGYTITRVDFWDWDEEANNYVNALTDSEYPFTCYMKSSTRSLRYNMSFTLGKYVAKIDVYGYESTFPPDTYNVTANLANGAYWSTFYTEAGNYQAPEGTQVFAVNLTGSTITMTEIEDRIVTSGKGVVLKQATESSAATTSIIMTLTENSPAGDFTTNSLLGTMYGIETFGPNYNYVLNYINEEGKGVGFYNLNSTHGIIGANKAYLTYKGSLVREFFLFEDDATGIDSLTPALSEGEGAIYNLAGQRIGKMQKGINIVNGKKVIK